MPDNDTYEAAHTMIPLLRRDRQRGVEGGKNGDLVRPLVRAEPERSGSEYRYRSLSMGFGLEGVNSNTGFATRQQVAGGRVAVALRRDRLRAAVGDAEASGQGAEPRPLRGGSELERRGRVQEVRLGLRRRHHRSTSRISRRRSTTTTRPGPTASASRRRTSSVTPRSTARRSRSPTRRARGPGRRIDRRPGPGSDPRYNGRRGREAGLSSASFSRSRRHTPRWQRPESESGSRSHAPSASGATTRPPSRSGTIPTAIEFSKYCRWCGKHTPHRETR